MKKIIYILRLSLSILGIIFFLKSFISILFTIKMTKNLNIFYNFDVYLVYFTKYNKYFLLIFIILFVLGLIFKKYLIKNNIFYYKN